MQDYAIFLDITPSRPNEAPTYQVTIGPSVHGRSGGGARGIKQYLTDKKTFITDLQQRLGCTNAEIERFFAKPDGHPEPLYRRLSDEDAAYFGWLQDYNR